MLVLLQVENQYKVWRNMQNPKPTAEEAKALRKDWHTLTENEPRKKRKYRLKHAIGTVMAKDIHAQDAFVPPASWTKPSTPEDKSQDEDEDETSSEQPASANAAKRLPAKLLSSTTQVKAKFRVYDKHGEFVCYALDLMVTTRKTSSKRALSQANKTRINPITKRPKYAHAPAIRSNHKGHDILSDNRKGKWEEEKEAQRRRERKKKSTRLGSALLLFCVLCCWFRFYFDVFDSVAKFVPNPCVLMLI